MLFNQENTNIHGEHAQGMWIGDVLDIRFDDCDWAIFTMHFPKMSMIYVEGIELDIENLGPREATLYGYAGEEDLYCWSSGLLRLAPGEREKLRVYCFHGKSAEVAEAFPHMMGAPGRYARMEWPEDASPNMLGCLRIETEGQGHAVHIALHGVLKYGLCNPPAGEAAKQLYPIMDRYGQYRHGDWVNKIHRKRDFILHNEHETHEIAASPEAPGRDLYGGWLEGPRHSATGHFYVKKIGGRWWFIDPEGYLYWAFGPAYVQPSCKAAIEGFEYLYEVLAPDGDFYMANLMLKYGADWEAAFINRAHERIKHWGMNTFGIAADRELCLTSRTPYCMGINSLGFAARNGLGELGGAWKRRLAENAARVCEASAVDPYCIGYFIDNEIHDRPDFDRWDYYYANCSDVLKKYAPDKLYLGSRQDWHRYPRGGAPMRIDLSDGPDEHNYPDANNGDVYNGDAYNGDVHKSDVHKEDAYKGYESVLRAYAAHADVLSFNQYRYTYHNLRMPEYADKPILISETTVGAMDRGMLHPSLRPTQNQGERAFACGQMLESALKNPWVAGVHWFMYMDQVCTGWEHNGENFQMGLVDICDTPYPELLKSIKETAYALYQRRCE